MKISAEKLAAAAAAVMKKLENTSENDLIAELDSFGVGSIGYGLGLPDDPTQTVCKMEFVRSVNVVWKGSIEIVVDLDDFDNSANDYQYLQAA